jgi:hypothetical protein
MQSLFDTHKDQIEHATTAADIERIVKTGKIAAFLTVEGGHTIDDDLRVLRRTMWLLSTAMGAASVAKMNSKPTSKGLSSPSKSISEFSIQK